jgi:hypothetical protein
MRERSPFARAVCLVSFSIGLASPATRAGAQQAGGVPRLPEIGSRVRLTSSSAPSARITGVLRLVYGDSLVVERADRSLVALARGDVERVEVRVRERAAQQVATALGVAGAAGGTVVYVNWCRQNPEECRRDAFGDGTLRCDCPDDDSHLAVPTLLILGGALLGAGIGYGLVNPQWRTVNAPLRLGVVPLGARGVVVGARLAWGGPRLP